MNHRITLMRLATGKDATGQPVEAWTDIATIWADVRFPTGAEIVRASLEVSIVRASIRIRTRPDVDASMRVRHKGVVYDIKSALPDADPQFMFIVCEAAK